MELEYKNKIYDRLLAIKLKMEIQAIPNPQYINEKIGECHVYIEEVERFSIEVCKEISIIQQVFNNAMAEYEIRKESLLIREDIKNLPNIKDREAHANILLSKERERTKEYQNELNDLNNLLKVTNLKIKNLNRANADIKVQLRLLEAQIKLGAGPTTDIAVKSLMEEMKKSQIDDDSFKEVSTKIIEEQTLDPSVPWILTIFLVMIKELNPSRKLSTILNRNWDLNPIYLKN